MYNQLLIAIKLAKHLKDMKVELDVVYNKASMHTHKWCD